MTVTKQAVLKCLNMEEHEFQTDTIDLHIQSATVYVRTLVGGNVSASLFDEAVMRYAAYLAYLSYADHAINDLPVQIDERTGEMRPAQSVVNRTIEALDQLRAAAMAAIELAVREGAGPKKMPVFRTKQV
ncbi:MAG TPA: hypothetical protein PK659_09235 [Methanothrix sp.]|nr:hypothetical protein [Methanothrix sp.]HOK59190.1 hypothetical protein [Methanothrix sp.]HOL44421.1 hypothetical protein [Methanothrix sp.]HPO89353.1 hypothetical protein [Methanothrix sp.]